MNYALLTSATKGQVNNCSKTSACMSKLMNHRNVTHDSYSKGALKYSRSNLGTQQSDLQLKIEKNISGGLFNVKVFRVPT